MAVTRAFDAGEAVNEELIQLYDFFGAMRRRLVMIASISLAFGIAMAVLAYTMKPVYRVFAILAPVTSGHNALTEGFNSSLAGGLISALTAGASEEDKRAAEAVAVLTSREFTERFISDNDLLPVLFHKMWDARAGRWKEGTKKTPTLELGCIAFDKIRKIDLDTDSDFITIKIDWPERFKAVEWVNQLAERLNVEMRKRAIASAEASLAHLQVEFANTAGVETRAAISRLIEGEMREKMLATVMQDYQVRFIDKATVPDVDFPQRPIKSLMIGVGLLFGLLVGIAVSLLLYRRELSSGGLL
jgi:LPS O-antigen subunit length determinant protein (WzzB/FepE family)